MIICSQCGNALIDGLRFCTECGAEPTTPSDHAPTLILQPEPRPSALPSASPQQAPTIERPAPNTNPLVYIVPVGGIILLIGVLALYSNSKSASRGERDASNARLSSSESENNNFESKPRRNASGSSNMNANALSSNSQANTANVNSNSGGTTATLAYCNANSLWVRSAPVLDLTKNNIVGELTRGDRVWILSESSNYDTYNGITSNWAEVQVADRTLRGWVFRYYLERLKVE